MNTLKLRDYTGKALSECTILELYNAALALTQDACRNRGYNSGKKKVYYISAEFLIGKLLSNNLINLGIYDDVKRNWLRLGKTLRSWRNLNTSPPSERRPGQTCSLLHRQPCDTGLSR